MLHAENPGQCADSVKQAPDERLSGERLVGLNRLGCTSSCLSHRDKPDVKYRGGGGLWVIVVVGIRTYFERSGFKYQGWSVEEFTVNLMN